MLCSRSFLCFGLYDSCACRYILRYPDVTAYGSVFSDGDAPQDSGIGIHDDIIFQYGVAGNAFDGFAVFVQREAFGSEGYTLI